MSKIRFGKLREKVKSGTHDARDVLKWARKQRGISARFLRWLSNFDLETHKKRAEADRERREEQNNS